ncbi:MAG TPA: PepSY-like domain-containing protein [Flavisolibacter sp.]|nr:PepSY-like domain-containing protein [Flavisolibacter sp.]
MKKWISLTVLALTLSGTALAQVRKIPSEVTEAFDKQYPTAKEVEYKDVLTGINVQFLQDSARWIARYNPKGLWKESEKAWSYERLSPEIRDGFIKSKYAAEWKVTETAIIYVPGSEEKYRLKVEKNELQKKCLYFDKTGRLLRDAVTI